MIGLWVFVTAGSLVISAAATFWVRAVARRIKFIDQPGGHKQHSSPVALGGGIALLLSIWVPILAGTVVAWAIRGGPTPDWIPPILITHMEGIASKLGTILLLFFGALVLHLIGLVDDRRPLGVVPKLIAQTVVALFVAWLVGIRAVEALPPLFSIAITVLWIVLVTNAFNFLDNMDGLSAGVAAIAATIVGLASMNAGQIFVPTMALVFAGACVGFLLFNFSPASIFMGDAGSLVIGYTLAVLTLLTTYYDPGLGLSPTGIIVPVVVLAVPMYDVTTVVVYRLRAGESPFRGDRRHFSHRLTQRGLSTRKAVVTIYLATAATGLPAILLPRVDWPMAMLILVQCVCVVLIISILENT